MTLRGLLRSLVRSGTGPETPVREAKHIILTNEAALFVAAVTLGAIANPVLATRPMLWVPQVVQALGFAAIPLGARLWRPQLGPLVFGIFAVVTLSLGSWLVGAATDHHFYLLTVGSGAWLLNIREHWRRAAFLTALSLVAFVALDLGLIGGPSRAGLTADELLLMARVNHVLLFAIVTAFVVYAFQQTALAEQSLEVEQGRSERLLLNMLPAAIAARLKATPGPIADRFDEATVLFADIVHFTELCERASATEVVKMLDQVFTTFDRLAEERGLEKIKTIGDAYMVAAGIPQARADHVEAIASFALEMRARLRLQLTAPYDGLDIRVGIATGPVVAGVIGEKKFTYDLWGDTVNTASRMESHGLPGRIQVTGAVRTRLKGRFRFEPRGMIQVKGKGELETFFLEPLEDEQAP